jgi:hypothetical protein
MGYGLRIKRHEAIIDKKAEMWKRESAEVQKCHRGIVQQHNCGTAALWH